MIMSMLLGILNVCCMVLKKKVVKSNDIVKNHLFVKAKGDLEMVFQRVTY